MHAYLLRMQGNIRQAISGASIRFLMFSCMILLIEGRRSRRAGSVESIGWD